MTSRDIINDLIVNDGYATYLYVYNHVYPTGGSYGYPFTHAEFLRRGSFQQFFQHILFKIGREYSPTFGIEGKRVKKGFLEAFVNGLSSEATEEEKVFIMLKYKLTL